MKKSLLTIAILFCAISSFAMHRDKKAEQQKENPNEILSISMRRTACFGRCPDYMITLQKGGDVTYTGYMFVKDSGVYEKHYDAAMIQGILNKFQAFRIDTCSETYPAMIMDIPGIVYWVRYKDREQRIMNANFGPNYLADMAREIDAAIKVDGTWKRTNKEVKY